VSADWTTLNAILKEDYQPVVRDQINQQFLLFQQIDKNTPSSGAGFEGKRAVHAIHTTRNSGVGNRGQGGTLPAAGNQGYTQVKIPTRRVYGVGKVDRALIKAMRSNKGSFLRALASEMDGIKKDTIRDVNRQLWGTSNGVIAACGTTSNATTVVLAATTTETQILQLFADGGMRVDIGTVANPTLRASNRAVTGYSLTNKTITISGAGVTTDADDRVFRHGNGGASDDSGEVTDGQYELTGLQSIVAASGVLHTVDPATVPSWASYVDSNGGTLRNWSETGAVKVCQTVEKRSGENVELGISGDGVWRAIAAFYANQRRQLDTVELKGGYSGLRFSAAGEMTRPGQNPKALLWERDCPENRQFWLTPNALVKHELSDFEFVDEDGNVLDRADTDDFEFRLAGYIELGCVQRNAHGLYSDLNQS
jgi:hypothetical protein